MCGIAGKIHLGRANLIDKCEIERMLAPIRHRGPDGNGVFTQGHIGLGHQRLSIIDLATGAQPMSNEDDSIWIVFNGEIYNYPELRTKLLRKGHRFKTDSDTEVIIHLYEERGIDCVRDLRGMFAFAIWDTARQSLFVARDRVGIKPLYYCHTANTLWFASEIKAVIADPYVPRAVHPQAIDSFLAHNYLPGTGTLFEHVKRLPPGHTLTVNENHISIQQYWDLDFPSTTTKLPFEKCAENLANLIRRRVKDHLISDVPVGFLASGGVDSTALLSFAVEQTSEPIQTFTIGFDTENFADERPFARLAAKAFGTKHHEISMSASQFQDYLPSCVWHMEDPVCEPPAIALHYVSRLASQHVKVLLSGEGGDEAFGGYPNYRTQLYLERIKRVLGPMRHAGNYAAAAIELVPKLRKFADLARLLPTEIPNYYMSRTSSPFSPFMRMRERLYRPDFLRQVNTDDSHTFIRNLHTNFKNTDVLSRMLYVDTKTWLPDDLLLKADKITMGNSVELRVPLLDHDVLEFAATLPSKYKVHGMETKRVLKRAFKEAIPEEILNRRKTGFPVPYERWLETDCHDYVADTLLSTSALNRGYFARSGIESLLTHMKTAHTCHKEVFCLLTLELWHRSFLDRSTW